MAGENRTRIDPSRLVRSPKILFPLVAVLVLLLPACGGTSSSQPTVSTTSTTFVLEAGGGHLAFGGASDQKTLDFESKKSKGHLSFDTNGDGVVSAGEGGSFELSAGPPRGWPSSFPAPPSGKVVRGSIVQAPPVVQRSVTYTTEVAPSEVVSFYTKRLAALDPIATVDDADPVHYQASISFDGAWSGYITVGERSTHTVVGVQLVDEPG